MSDPKDPDSDAGAASSDPTEGFAKELEMLQPGPDASEADETTPEDDRAAGESGGAEVAALRDEVAALKDQLLRAAADLQNMRKRAERDRRDAETFGGAKLARDLLGVYDNLDAALNAASEDLQDRESGFFNGVELTRKELLNAFSKHRIEPVEPTIGERFDANRHQAMFEAPAPDAEPGSVIQVMQCGFMIADRLLRPAMVGVAQRQSASASDAAKTDSETTDGDESSDA